jgi:hypothetical protein
MILWPQRVTATLRPLFVDLKYLIHCTFTRFAITPFFHFAHVQKINLNDGLAELYCFLQEQVKDSSVMEN